MTQFNPYLMLNAKALDDWHLALRNMSASGPLWQMGVEKESLRVDMNGQLSAKPHPSAFGPPLCHPAITTDYAECLLELITPPCSSVTEVMDYLHALHHVVDEAMGDSYLWPSSLFCEWDAQQIIPIARFGRSPRARFQEQYRLGLRQRYGQLMQLFAGVHINFSFAQPVWQRYAKLNNQPDALRAVKNHGYFHLLRNVKQAGWLLAYWFGATPRANQTLGALIDESAYANATSLRMSDIGYQQSATHRAVLSNNQLSEYLTQLKQALQTPVPEYQAFTGEQVNAMLLQSESEHYAMARVKPNAAMPGRPWQVLRDHGVEYLELRCFDLDDQSPYGVDEDRLQFVTLLMWHALFCKSPMLDKQARAQQDKQLSDVAKYGAAADCLVSFAGKAAPVAEQARGFLAQLRPTAQMLSDVFEEDYVAVIRRLEQQGPSHLATRQACSDQTPQQVGEQQMRSYKTRREQSKVDLSLVRAIKSQAAQAREQYQLLEQQNSESDYQAYLQQLAEQLN